MSGADREPSPPELCFAGQELVRAVGVLKQAGDAGGWCSLGYSSEELAALERVAVWLARRGLEQ